MKTSITFILALCCLTTLAQQPDRALLKVKYAFAHVLDTTQKENVYKETMMLVVGKNASVYLSYDKAVRDREAKASILAQFQSQGDEVKMIKSPPLKRPFNEIEQYHFTAEGKLFTKEPMGVTYLTEEPIEKIEWRLSKTTRTIEGMSCKLATANFRGRNWEAWYNDELPFTAGPWKLNGLPGLILSAYDSTKEVVFDFAGMEQIVTNETSISGASDKNLNFGNNNYLTALEIILPKNVVNASLADVERLKETRIKDPKGFAKGQMAALGLTGLTPISTGNTKTPFVNPLYNIKNPIEKIIHK